MRRLGVVWVPLVAMLSACSQNPVSRPQLPAAAAPRVVPIGSAAAQPEPLRGTPFAGLHLAADERGLRVVGVPAGPAARAGFKVGDRLRDRGARTLTVADFQSMVATAGAGATLDIECLKDTKWQPCQVPIGVLESWIGPARFPREAPTAPSVSLAHPAWFDDSMVQVAAALGADQVSTLPLSSMFQRLSLDDLGAHRSGWLDRMFQDPGVLGSLPDLAAGQWGTAAEPAQIPIDKLCTWTPSWCGRPASPAGLPDSLDHGTLAAELERLSSKVEQAFAAIEGGRAALHPGLRALIENTAAGRLPYAQQDVEAMLEVLRDSLRVDMSALFAAFRDLVGLSDLVAVEGMDFSEVSAPDMTGIEGSVLAVISTSAGRVVIGGEGPNTYTLKDIVAVIDPGGDDHYVWPAAVPLPVQLIVDMAGNDVYQASYGGPGAGWTGIAVLRDRAGRDLYRSVFGGCGAGLFGFGWLADDRGADVYRCDSWSIGAGLYGAGVLSDRGGAADSYLSQALSQGLGGPGGVGLLRDEGGNDLYRANGLVPSAYGTPAVFLGLSQGVGYGLRPFDHGGVGLLLDEAGNDRYEGGEFSQGGGYFGGVGMLRDAAGNDLYYGQRYAQGFAAHQAAGVLADLSGDDVYWVGGYAGQAAAWDQSMAMLIEGQGDDNYRGGDLSQGAAAHQSWSLLYEAGGADRYWSDGRAQGVAGPNGYHFNAETPVHSLGILDDVGGTDHFSSGAGDGDSRVRGGADAAQQGDGTVGVTLDRGTAP